MAYMNQERKAKINAALKKAIPASWKWSLAVRNHMTIVLTIASAPADLLAAFGVSEWYATKPSHFTINPYWWADHLKDEELRPVFKEIFAALNDGNHDNSDIQTDYFDVGWYVDVNVGRWDKPFVNTALKEAA